MKILVGLLFIRCKFTITVVYFWRDSRNFVGLRPPRPSQPNRPRFLPISKEKLTCKETHTKYRRDSAFIPELYRILILIHSFIEILFVNFSLKSFMYKPQSCFGASITFDRLQSSILSFFFSKVSKSMLTQPKAIVAGEICFDISISVWIPLHSSTHKITAYTL